MLNMIDYHSEQEVVGDLAVLWRDILHEELNISAAELKVRHDYAGYPWLMTDEWPELPCGACHSRCIPSTDGAGHGGCALAGHGRTWGYRVSGTIKRRAYIGMIG